MKILYGVLLFLLGVNAVWTLDKVVKCPTLPAESSCKCVHVRYFGGSETRVVCRHIKDPQVLLKEIQQFRGYDIKHLTLSEVQLPYLPAGLFSGTLFKRIYIENSILENLYSITDAKPSPFEGLEDTLEEIHVESTSDPSKWLWPEVKNLKKLRVFQFNKSPINFIGHIFAEIGDGSLESITATYSRVYRIHPQAFTELTNLTSANFAGNYLPYLVRTMFPNPAPQLRKLDFRDNRLFTVNENMFENMPALTFLDLSQNEFKTFENVAFTPIWEQLSFFYISDNPFRCDCSLVPLKEHFDWINDASDVKCMNEGDYKKTSLRDLQIDTLQCKQ